VRGKNWEIKEKRFRKSRRRIIHLQYTNGTQEDHSPTTHENVQSRRKKGAFEEAAGSNEAGGDSTVNGLGDWGQGKIPKKRHMVQGGDYFEGALKGREAVVGERRHWRRRSTPCIREGGETRLCHPMTITMKRGKYAKVPRTPPRPEGVAIKKKVVSCQRVGGKDLPLLTLIELNFQWLPKRHPHLRQFTVDAEKREAC